MGFYNFVKTGENFYTERFGLDFEDFKVGQVFEHRPGVTLHQVENKQEALATLNAAQLHYDNNYALSTEWKKELVVTTLTIQNLFGAGWKTFYKKDKILGLEDLNMLSPVFAGDTLYARSTVLEKSDYDNERGLLKIQLEGLNQFGTVVSRIVYEMTVFRQGFYPPVRNSEVAFTHVSEERFLGLRTLSADHYIEQTGLYFEEFRKGEVFRHGNSKTFLPEESVQHVVRGLNFHPRYSDRHFAEKYFPNESGLVDEVLLISGIITLTTQTLAKVVANLAMKKTRIHAAVNVSDSVHCESEILDLRDSNSRPEQGILTVETRGYKQNNELVLSFERTLLVYKKGCGPYGKSGFY